MATRKAQRTGKPRVAIIGAGVGGLAAGIRLAAQGCEVHIYERNERIGGKLNLVEVDGWSFDTGPSLLTMPGVARDLFSAAGASLDEELELLPLDPICRYVYPDGIIFDAPAEIERMAAELESFGVREAEGFEAFIDYGRRVYDITAGPFLFSPLKGIGDVGGQLLRRLNRPIDIGRVLSPISLDALVRHHFHDPHMRQLFDRYATYNGSSPYQAPAVYAIIPYVEYSFGAWYPKGGMYQLARALERLASKVGVTIHTNSIVSQIRVGTAGVEGLELADDHFAAADVVISNVDIATTYRRLILDAMRNVKTMRKFDTLEPSLSGFVLLLGVDRKYDELQHHNIYFSQDYKREFYDIFQRLVAPRDPTIYVCATSRTDATQAPAGGENLFVLVNVPYLSDEFNWTAQAQGYRNLIVERLEQMGLTDLSHHIVYEQMLTPEDLATRYGAQRGAIYGFSSNNLFAPFQRPQNRDAHINGLYFVGGSVHPGGGLPLVMLSGKITAGLITEDWER